MYVDKRTIPKNPTIYKQPQLGIEPQHSCFVAHATALRASRRTASELN